MGIQASGEGVQVHGDWTIDVRDPDGTLVEHREFKNALASYADQNLSLILTGQYVLGAWQLRFNQTTDYIPPFNAHFDPGVTGSPCYSVTTSQYLPCDVTVEKGVFQGTITLNGNWTAGRTGTIETVATVLDVRPFDQPNFSQVLITFKRIPPLPVTRVGQIVQFSVVISFS